MTRFPEQFKSQPKSWIYLYGIALVALVCAKTASGQGFSQLATNADGAVLYFSSPLRLKGTNQYFHPKIFKWDSDKGISLYEQRATDFPFPDFTHLLGGIGTDFFELVAPDVSSDGRTVAVTGIRYCFGGDGCVFDIEENQSTIYTRVKPALAIPGSAILSRNGRYALMRGSPNSLFQSQYLLVDLQTGNQTQYFGAWQPLPGTRRPVANDGTIVLADPSGISVGTGGQLQVALQAPITGAPNRNPMINAAATLVFYEAGGNGATPARLSVYSVKDGSSKDLITDSADSPGFGASISDDGALVAFLYGKSRQVYVVRSDETGFRQLTNFPEAVTEVALSGDGSIAFAVTSTNRIARIQVATVRYSDIVPPTPYTNLPGTNGFANSFISGYRILVSRGSVTKVTGAGFSVDSETAHPPFPLSLGGVELRVGGNPVPIAGVAPDSIDYPAPWDLPDSPMDVEVIVSLATGSPFVAGFELAPAPPSFFLNTSDYSSIIAVHQDFGSLVSALNPARAGESFTCTRKIWDQ